MKASVNYVSDMHISSGYQRPCHDDCLSFIHLTGSFDGNAATGAFGCETALSDPLGGRTDICRPPLGLHNTKQSRVISNTGMREDRRGFALCFTILILLRVWKASSGKKPIVLEAKWSDWLKGTVHPLWKSFTDKLICKCHQCRPSMCRICLYILTCLSYSAKKIFSANNDLISAEKLQI